LRGARGRLAFGSSMFSVSAYERFQKPKECNI
jgi:hypothetical protein